MAKTYDAIIIGSGFGGSVLACRLSEKGLKVLVLERGRRWKIADYPSQSNKDWIFNRQNPEKENGWLDLRVYKHMAVAQGAGVGGGSLIYANISVEAPKEAFDQGWPDEITHKELKPYYARVGKMLNVQTLPKNQLTERYKLMREAAGKIGAGKRFTPLPMAVTFNPKWNYKLKDAFDVKNSKTWKNAQGVQQGTCVHCGNCDIGCPTHAKNTLDLNYLAWAEKKGAEIRPLHLVQYLAPEKGGYRVYFDRLEDGRRVPGSETADRVFLTAGTMASTELLLKCRDEYKTLPHLSPFLGHDWSSNGDFLTPASYGKRAINPTQGPTITCAIDFLDGSQDKRRFFIEDGGFPDLLNDWLDEEKKRSPFFSRFNPLRRWLEKILLDHDSLSNIMPWFAQGVDAANGRLTLGRPWWAFWGPKELQLDWEIERSAKLIDAIVAMHQKLSAATGGTPQVPPTWDLLKFLVTPHPLGGCNMGGSKEKAVVNHLGEVFGYPRLYVSDGAIVPEAIGRNPSRTIAALSERIAAHIR
ncbi:MAG TPA: GMC family oxidoreductase [bacterium]|jgi:cholesterol oxidase|nr:GMC family oxidoreductase [bacterium]